VANTATTGFTAQTSWTTGDLMYASNTNTLSKLSIGTASRFLESSGTIPQWTAPLATNGHTGQTSYLTGDLLYASAANTLSKLAIGSASQILTVTGGVPTWADSITG
jgi:hypothetical protein